MFNRFVLGPVLLVMGLAACSASSPQTPVDASGSVDAQVGFDATPDGGPDGGPDAGLEADGGALEPQDAAGGTDQGPALSAVPRAVEVARATVIPACTLFVDAANAGPEDGTVASPFATIAAAVDQAAPGAIICVAEGRYPESIAPGLKPFTLAGGFQRGQGFTVRDSARYPSRAEGNGTGSFLRIEDEGPSGGELTAVDGFEITGYSQAVVRDVYYDQRFDLTHNFIHDNRCDRADLVGAGFAFNNITGSIRDNVIARNTCSRGGAGYLGDSTNTNVVVISGNLIEDNVGDEPGISHGGGLYVFGNDLTITANTFQGNRATGWGGGLYLGAFSGGGQTTNARLRYNVYRNNRVENSGGGFFCDDGARCDSDHELYDRNCGGNILLDCGPDGSAPTRANFDHLTNYGALEVGCGAPGAGVIINKSNTAADVYTFTNSLFWGNGPGLDFAASCEPGFCNVTVDVQWSSLDTTYLDGGVNITFGPGVLDGLDPAFVDPAAQDFHLRSTQGHWTPAGYVVDGADSPALAAGDPTAASPDNPERAGTRTELGFYGNTVEASYTR